MTHHEAHPLVSVVVPTKHSARTIEACLASIRAQTYVPIELVVVDNRSVDATAAIAAKFADRIIVCGPERSAQRNEGARAASGEYIAFIDSDMVLAPRVIEECVAALQTEVGVIGAVIPEESFGRGFWAECKRLERMYYVGVPWMEAARFFRRRDFLSSGGYDESLVSGEDWDMSQRMEEGGTLARIKERIFHDEGQLTLGTTIKKKWYYAKEFAKYAAKPSHAPRVRRQTGIIARYTLFLSKPRLLLTNPAIGMGMLFMKTCEFAAGTAAYAVAKMAPGL